jgi:SHS2 domain-containing protein
MSRETGPDPRPDAIPGAGPEAGRRKDPGDGTSFEFVEGATSDLAFVARGPTPESVFAAAAQALLAATVEEPERLAVEVRQRVVLEEPALDLLLLRWLDELIWLRDARQLLLRAEQVTLHGGPPWRLEAELGGGTIGGGRRLRADVKAATAHGLWVGESDGGWEARVTLDV